MLDKNTALSLRAIMHRIDTVRHDLSEMGMSIQKTSLDDKEKLKMLRSLRHAQSELYDINHEKELK
ncbi:hypothetical protein [Campylobacter sp. RM16192]|uniref:hypothetical protein n=1 Tax=Campylobacter sp. RM16192 TaxID=1660080 RepID=UPI0014513BEF|nr:hypothetical protein [Campylobacter sp. RM16192]QCD52477.1 hypothetical protein CDOMC_0854 [Campylobacter sp. RM16192]